MSANAQSEPNTVPTVEVADKPVIDSNQTNDRARENERARPEDDALLKLRQKRITATAADKGNILQDFARAEKQYPNDYRFPYEHAKLAVAGPQIKSFDGAFKALFAAAERAIKAGKAQEMLQGLQADKAGDFQKLARGHSEWSQLVQALKNKDTKFLAANTRLAQAM
jgi:ABC-type amino acid transport substrate-binding protein